MLLVRHLPGFRYDPSRRFRAWLWTLVRNRWAGCRRGPAGPSPLGDLDRGGGPDPADAVADAEYGRYVTARALALMRDDFHETTWRACWA